MREAHTEAKIDNQLDGWSDTVKFVIIESPYSAKSERALYKNVRFARSCMLDSLNRGEAPFLSHLLYTQVWDDNDPRLRAAGINAGLEIGKRADKTIVYTNLGISEGMSYGIRAAEEAGRPIEYRLLEEWR